MGLRTWLKRVLEQPSHVHLAQEVAGTPGDLIDLIDRFIDGPMRYPLEWDDFISWEQANPNVEAARQAIGQYEPWLFSQSAAKKNAYAYRVIEERNRLAAIIGRPQRDLPSLGDAEDNLINPSAMQ
jgi:hypothetical protein